MGRVVANIAVTGLSTSRTEGAAIGNRTTEETSDENEALLALDAIQLIDKAEVLVKSQDMHSAVSAYRDWLARSDSPLRFAIAFNLGVLLENIGNFSDAERCYRKSVSQNSDFIQARLQLAVQLERRGAMQEASEQRAWLASLETKEISGNQPLSILIPVYNTPASQLSMCLQSIYAQTYSNYEILIVNDASTNEECIEFLRNLRDSKITIINLSENKGIAGALNVGLQVAKHEFVARMDSDDMMLPLRLEKQMEYLKNNPHVDVLSTGLYYCIETAGVISFDPVPKIHPEIVTKELAKISRWFVNHPTVIYKKCKVLAVGGYDDSLRGLPEDYDLWVRMLDAGMVIRNLLEPLLYLRLSSSSLSNSFCDDIEEFFKKRQ
jgi:hypothetical protein